MESQRSHQNSNVGRPQSSGDLENDKLLDEKPECKLSILEKETSKVIQKDVEHQQDISYYYNQLFSPMEFASSIRKRNEELQIMEFDKKKLKSNQIAIYNRRTTKAKKLQIKQTEQLSSLYAIQLQNPQKFSAIFQILRFLSEIKAQQKIDYFSQKTFIALKGCTVRESQSLLKVLKRIYGKSKQVLETKQKTQMKSNISEQQFKKQFLLVLRFLISRQKILELIRQEQVQQSFIFMIGHMFLSPENNQANKKIPDQKLVLLLTPLAQQSNGRQKFKVICSINHGNKFRLRYGAEQYQKLFEMSYQKLRELQIQLKKKKGYNQVQSLAVGQFRKQKQITSKSKSKDVQQMLDQKDKKAQKQGNLEAIRTNLQLQINQQSINNAKQDKKVINKQSQRILSHKKVNRQFKKDDRSKLAQQ